MPILSYIGTLPDQFGSNGYSTLPTQISFQWLATFPHLPTHLDPDAQGNKKLRVDHPPIISIVSVSPNHYCLLTYELDSDSGSCPYPP